MWFVLLQVNCDVEDKLEVELYGPFATAERADQWIQELHPTVKARKGFQAIITTATPVGREYEDAN